MSKLSEFSSRGVGADDTAPPQLPTCLSARAMVTDGGMGRVQTMLHRLHSPACVRARAARRRRRLLEHIEGLGRAKAICVILPVCARAEPTRRLFCVHAWGRLCLCLACVCARGVVCRARACAASSRIVVCLCARAVEGLCIVGSNDVGTENESDILSPGGASGTSVLNNVRRFE
jgi:hypothetical protein